MKVTILSKTGDPEKIIAAAAKLCYSNADISEVADSLSPEKAAYYINLTAGMGHESVLEHAAFTFGIEGVSRALLAQITRHRIASFSVQSQRYVNMDGFGTVIPPAIAALPEARAIFESAIAEDRRHYENLSAILALENFKRLNDASNLSDSELSAENNSPSSREMKNKKSAAQKKANEDARFVLPAACETKFIMTMNARELLHFFELRACNRAQWEIRALAEEMIRLLKSESPLLFSAAGPPCVRSGVCPEGKFSCGKIKEMRGKN